MAVGSLRDFHPLGFGKTNKTIAHGWASCFYEARTEAHTHLASSHQQNELRQQTHLMKCHEDLNPHLAIMKIS